MVETLERVARRRKGLVRARTPPSWPPAGWAIQRIDIRKRKLFGVAITGEEEAEAAVDFLDRTLSEEKETDAALTELAESAVNVAAEAA